MRIPWIEDNKQIIEFNKQIELWARDYPGQTFDHSPSAVKMNAFLDQLDFDQLAPSTKTLLIQTLRHEDVLNYGDKMTLLRKLKLQPGDVPETEYPNTRIGNYLQSLLDGKETTFFTREPTFINTADHILWHALCSDHPGIFQKALKKMGEPLNILRSECRKPRLKNIHRLVEEIFEQPQIVALHFNHGFSEMTLAHRIYLVINHWETTMTPKEKTVYGPVLFDYLIGVSDNQTLHFDENQCKQWWGDSTNIDTQQKVVDRFMQSAPTLLMPSVPKDLVQLQKNFGFNYKDDTDLSCILYWTQLISLDYPTLLKNPNFFEVFNEVLNDITLLSSDEFLYLYEQSLIRKEPFDILNALGKIPEHQCPDLKTSGVILGLIATLSDTPTDEQWDLIPAKILESWYGQDPAFKKMKNPLSWLQTTHPQEASHYMKTRPSLDALGLTQAEALAQLIHTYQTSAIQASLEDFSPEF